jgi:hypothetical protein
MKPANMFWGIDSKGPTLLSSFSPKRSSELEKTSHDLEQLTRKHEMEDNKAALAAAISSARSTTSSDAVASNPFGGRLSSDDPITAALTASSSPNSTYYDVLKALIAAVRTLLIPKKNDDQILSLPRTNQLGEAFPKSVQDEDPAYFYKLTLKQKEEAGKNSNYVKGLEKAWAAVREEDLFYAFDRKSLPLPHQINKENRDRAKELHQKQFGDIKSRSGTPIIVGSSRNKNKGGKGKPVYDISNDNEDEEFLVRDPEFRKESVSAIETRHGLSEGVQTVGKASGGTAISIGVGGSNNPANKPVLIGPDVMADTLRWVEQQRVAQEHKRARCEHVIHLLSEEIAKETKRQKRLRISASKFAASEARSRGDPDWKTFLIGVAENDEKGSKKSVNEEREERLMSGLDPKAHLRSLRFHSKDEGSGSAPQLTSSGGASRFTAKDMALVKFDCAKERAEGTDAIMRILEDYRMVPLSVSASYLEQSLQTMDELYAELVGARLQEASGGVPPSKEQISAHLEQVRADVEVTLENEENDDAFLNSLSPEERELQRRLKMRKEAKRGASGIVPNAYYQKVGGAVPMKKHEDLLETKLYGAAKPGRGLSAFNMRPSQGRAAVREAGKIILPSDIDEGFEDAHVNKTKEMYTSLEVKSKKKNRKQDDKSPYSKSVGSASVSTGPSVGSRGPQSKPPRVEVKEDMLEFPDFDQVSKLESYAAKVAQDKTRQNYANVIQGQANHAVKYAASQTVALLSAENKDEDDSDDVVVDNDSMVIGGKTNIFVKIRELRNKERAQKKAREAAKAAIKASKPNPVVAKEGEDPTPGAFKELEADLIRWRETSRPSWQQQIQKSYDLSNLRESTGMMLSHIQRTAKEPPDGRFSHLTGRYMMADDLRVQLNDARKQKFET